MGATETSQCCSTVHWGDQRMGTVNWKAFHSDCGYVRRQTFSNGRVQLLCCLDCPPFSLLHSWLFFFLCFYPFLLCYMFSLFVCSMFLWIGLCFPWRHGFCLCWSLLLPRALNSIEAYSGLNQSLLREWMPNGISHLHSLPSSPPVPLLSISSCSIRGSQRLELWKQHSRAGHSSTHSFL